jgi:hypothetical protein
MKVPHRNFRFPCEVGFERFTVEQLPMERPNRNLYAATSHAAYKGANVAEDIDPSFFVRADSPICRHRNELERH